MTTIYLVSNNITNKNYINDKNNDNIEFKIKKLSLNNNGINNAIKISKLIKKINYIYSSTYNTGIETANYLSKYRNRTVRLDKRLDLRKIGITKLSELPYYYDEQSYLDSDYKLPKGESQNEVRNRMYNIINEIEIKHQNKNIVLISHKINIIYLLRIWNSIKYNEVKNINDPIIYKIVFDCNKIKNIEKLNLTNL